MRNIEKRLAAMEKEVLDVKVIKTIADWIRLAKGCYEGEAVQIHPSLAAFLEKAQHEKR
mgnify:CR=1 FL=1